MMREIRGLLAERIKRTPTVESFRFIPSEKIHFAAGQFLEMVFDEVNRNNRDLNKYLSISSSPSKDYIEVTKRLSASEFSGRLKNLDIGNDVLLKLPLGNCVFDESYKKIGFLIGGIGITPVISIIEYIIDNKFDTDVCLIYSNRTDEEIAFRNELDLWQSLNKKIKVSYLVTDCEPKDKNCFFGRIDLDFLKYRHCDLKERVSFIFGPPKMVESLAGLCAEMECTKDSIKTESFVGY